jgi:CTP-dependent riboflavin kinase
MNPDGIISFIERLMNRMVLNGKLNLISTVGKFKILISENKEVFRKYFGVYLFPGSVNVKIEKPENLQQELDKGNPPPNFIIPRTELVGMPDYIGDGQIWRCVLLCDKFIKPINCWLFRRIGSKVPKGIIEIVAEQELVKPHSLKDGDSVVIELV